MSRGSELSEAFQIASALPELRRQQLERLSLLLKRLPTAELANLADAIEKHPGYPLYERLMKVLGKKVRVAEWYVDSEGRCQHRRYAEGNAQRAKYGGVGDYSWLEAWIA